MTDFCKMCMFKYFAQKPRLQTTRGNLYFNQANISLLLFVADQDSDEVTFQI